MAIDFPSSPSVNDTFTVGDTIYKWDGAVWTSTVSGAVDFLPLTGGTVTGAITASGGVTGDLTGDVTGNVTGDLTGSVTGNVTGDLTGDVTGNASTVSISGGTFGTSSQRPIACWGTTSTGGGVTESDIKVPVSNSPTIRGDGRIFCDSIDIGGKVLNSTNINKNYLGASLAGMDYGQVGSYGFFTMRDTTGDKSPGITAAAGGGTLRWSNASGGNYSTSSPSGTWRLQGRLEGSSSNSDPAETSLWIRVA